MSLCLLPFLVHLFHLRRRSLTFSSWLSLLTWVSIVLRVESQFSHQEVSTPTMLPMSILRMSRPITKSTSKWLFFWSSLPSATLDEIPWMKWGKTSEEFSKMFPLLWWDLQVHERLKFPVPPVEGCTTIACWFLQGSPVGVSWEIQVSTESSYHCKQAKLSDHNIWQFWQVCLVVHQGAIVAICKGVEEVQVGSMWSILQILRKWKWKCCKKRW